ncbi:C39 family peptidase [uncultured Draconibacterium sp.]|uniref:C39 family peptidase n=1 Tax=uncultured Draconibacterium sp. TaxID=1573823 RepID=UPI0025E3EF8F|nr:C39 family peptidase [uncultured Draconibacterium sp.]
MKRTFTLFLFSTFILLGLALSSMAQQSSSGPERPANVSPGIIKPENALNTQGGAGSKTITSVPSYIWHRGCGPTAVGMVLGYYDLNGFPDLIDGDASTQTTGVDDAIASTGHYDDYSQPIDNTSTGLMQDKSELGGAHTSNSVADFMSTSWSSRNNYYGWSWSSDIAPSFTNYVALRNSTYQVTTSTISFTAVGSWENYKNEIDNDRPVVLLVDTDGNGGTDHFVTGIGYDEDLQQYAIYDTWNHDIHWYDWAQMASGVAWGIYNYNTFQMNTSGVSEQDSLALVDLYNSTDGDNWTNNENWLNGPVSSWYGIAMQDTNVTEISLDQNNLIGSLPASLGQISQLEWLALGGNLINGSLPTELGNLENLRFFFLWGNQLSGVIPSSFGQLSSLNILSLNGNQLSGDIPPELQNCSNLWEINLDWNLLDGTIPSELCNLQNLGQVNFANNFLDSTSCDAIACLFDNGVSFADGDQLQQNGFSLLNGCIDFPDTVAITFRVDMQNEQVSPNGVHINGSFSQWAEAIGMENESGSIYSATLSLQEGDTLLYKFINGGTSEWDNYEVPPSGCTIGDANDRQLIIPAVDSVLNLVCFEACAACVNDSIPQYAIAEIQGDGDVSPLSGQVVRTKGRIIGVNQHGFYMQDTTGIRSGIFVYDPVLAAQLAQGDQIEIIAEVTEYGGRTELLNVEWFDYTDEFMDVHLSYIDVAEINEDYECVFVALLEVAVVDTTAFGEYIVVSPDGDTTIISNFLVQPLMEIGRSYKVYGVVDYQYNAFRVNPRATAGVIPLYDLTFNVDMQNDSVDPAGVFVGGDWNSWMSWVEPVQMTADGSVYSASIKVQSGVSIAYKFANGTEWENLSGPCIDQNGDRNLLMPDSAVTLDVVCFASCYSCISEPVAEYTIAEIQGEGDISPLDGQVVRTKGRLIAVNEYGFYMQDTTGIRSGIFVYDPALAASLNQGDHIEIVAEVDEYNGRTELFNTQWADYTDEFFPVYLSYIDVAEIGEDYECVFVALSDVTVVELTETNEYLVVSDAGDTARIGRYLIVPSMEIGETYNVLGVVDYHWGDWRVYPRSQDGIQFANPLERDSLALVDLYYATNGDGWNDTTNWFSGPVASWYGVSVENDRVTSIWLDQNNLVGELPESIGNLSALQYLDLGGNQISGTLPASMGNLSSLEVFHIWWNQLSGNIPEELGNIPFLTVLNLSGNMFDGEIPQWIGQSQSLGELMLEYNNFSGAIPESLCSTPVHAVSFQGNLFDSTSCPAIGCLIENGVTFIDDEAQMQQDGYRLTVDCGYNLNPVSSQDSLALVALYHATDGDNWYYNINWLNGPVYTWGGVVVENGRVVTLDLGGNNLNGPIPPEFYNLTAIRTIALSNNNLTGTLSSAIENFTDLKYVYFQNNALEGSIPAEFGAHSQLVHLILYGNQFSGTIPASLGNCTDLQYLYLHYNNLSGSIPTELGQLTAMEILVLGNNDLTGEIPASFGNLSSLQRLYAENNSLSTLPSELCNTPIWQTNLSGNLFDSTSCSAMSCLVAQGVSFTDYYQEQQSGYSLLLDCGFNLNPCSEADSLALIDFYTATNGDNWLNNDDWMDGPVYTWYGITVENGRVTSIDLPENDLNGAIPASIGQLDGLTELLLNGNDIGGTLPDEMGNLTQLEVLWLEYNQLDGALPTALCGLPLMEANFEYNWLDENSCGAFTCMINSGVSFPNPVQMQNNDYQLISCVSDTSAYCENIGLVGDFNQWGNFGSDILFEQNPQDPSEWLAEYYFEADMQVKFRQNQDWSVNWGGEYFPAGVGYQDGPNIYVPAGNYTIHFNCATSSYWFEETPYGNMDILTWAAPINPYPAYSLCNPGVEDVAVTLTNNGNNAVENFRIGLTFNGDTMMVDQVNMSIAPGDTFVYYFSEPLDFSTLQYYQQHHINVFIWDDLNSNNDNYYSRYFHTFGDYQDHSGWTTYNSCRGLTADISFGITQDKNGHVWTTSFYGADRFNGSQWEAFSAANGLAENYSWAMEHDAAGNVWFAGTGDTVITKYDGTGFSYYPQPAVFEECIYSDSQGNMWFGAWEGTGVARFDGESWTYFMNEEIGFNGNITSIGEDVHGNIWVACNGASNFVFQYNGSEWLQYALPGQADGTYVTEIFFDTAGKTWFAGSNIIAQYDGSNWTFFTPEDGIPAFCQDITEDSRGNLWFGGGRTLVKYDGQNWISYSAEDGMIAASVGDIYAVYADTDDNIWVGTYRGGISVLNQNQSFCGTTQLSAGWNILATPVEPDSADLEWHFQGLIDNGALIKVQDETGNALEDLGVYGGWQNYIGDLLPTEGYKVKMLWDDSIAVCGTSVEYPYPIPLNEGWNIMGYPQIVQADAMDVVQQLIDRGVLLKVQDEGGQSIEDLGVFGGWTNFIGIFDPGEGYKIKVSQNDTLWIFGAYNKSSQIRPAFVLPEFFNRVYQGNGVDHMNLNIADLPVDELAEGDELAVYDGSLCVGAVSLQKHHLQQGIVSIPVSAADNSGMPGFTEGHSYELHWWQQATNSRQVLSPVLVSGPEVFAKHESALLSLAQNGLTPVDLLLSESGIKLYPNPFNEELTIEVSNLVDTRLDITVLNQLGQLVSAIANKQQVSEGLHHWVWKGTNAAGQEVNPGVYYIQVTANDKTVINKVVLTE